MPSWPEYDEDEFGPTVLELDGPSDDEIAALVEGLEIADDCW